jgi:hypothetical protein
MRPAEHVDRVELKDAKLLDQRRDAVDARRLCRPTAIKALRGKGDAPRLREAKPGDLSARC